MTVLPWYQVASDGKDVGIVDGYGELVVYYSEVWDKRVVEFNGKLLGFVDGRAEAEELLYKWAHGLVELMK